MYIVHLSNPTRQVRLDANRMYIDEGFITFQIQRGPGEDDPLRVASFRAEDVTAVYDQEYIQSVIDLPNIGSGSRIPFETSRRTNEVDVDYAPAIIRQGSTAIQVRQYPPTLGQPISFAIPPAHPIPPRPTRGRYEVSADNMSRSQSYGQSLAVGEDF